MKPAVIVPTGRRLPGLLALVAVAAALGGGGYAVQSCGAKEYPASVAWTGSAYGVAWAKPELGAAAVYAHRFDSGAFNGALTIKGNRGRTFVHRVRRLASPPEIVGNADGFLVFIHSADDEDRPTLLAVPLDPSGQGSGPVKVAGVNVHALCKSPTWNGWTFSYAYTTKYVDGTRTVWTITLAEMNIRGEIIRSEWYLVDHGRSPALQCSIAADEQGDIAFSYAGYGTEYSPLRLLRYGDQWAKLRVENLDDRTMAVDIFDDDGRLSRTFPVPKWVNASTADLGVNQDGLFITWIGKGKVHVLPLGAAKERVKHRVSSDARGSRTVGHDDRCAIAWSVDGGKSARLAVAEGCTSTSGPAPR